MKKIIFIFSILLIQSVFADKKEYMQNYVIPNKAHKATYLLLKCETEVNFYNTEHADASVCIKAAHSLKNGDDLKPLAEKHRNKYTGESYFNAGVIYQFQDKNHKKALESYLKAYKEGYCNYDNCSVGRNIGYYYATGEGGNKMDKILAYKYFLESAKHGNEGSQHNLDYLCKESPWACK
jgi:TPR repeat protein